MEAFESLEVWKRSSRLCSELYKSLHDCREWGFRDQIIRSALSVPSNIAEGYERNSRNEYSRFLKIAKGSCGELRTQLYIAKDVKLIQSQPASMFLDEAAQISRMLQGLIDSL